MQPLTAVRRSLLEDDPTGRRRRRRALAMKATSEFGSAMRQRWADWLLVGLMAVLFVGVEYSVEPYVRYIPQVEIEELNYPLKDDTVPAWVIPLGGLLLPLLVFTAYRVLWKCEAREFHDLILGSLMNVMLTACVTSTLKEMVGRPRPDYFRRCFPDGVMEFNDSGYPLCHPVSESILREGRKSFPSGHSSWSMCTLSFLSFFLMGKLQVFSGTQMFWKYVVSLLPFFVAVGVGVTRVNDYWHHWTDVAAGALIGLAISFSIYIQLYRTPWARADTHTPIYQLMAQTGRHSFIDSSMMLVPRSAVSIEIGGKEASQSQEGLPLLEP